VNSRPGRKSGIGHLSSGVGGVGGGPGPMRAGASRKRKLANPTYRVPGSGMPALRDPFAEHGPESCRWRDLRPLALRRDSGKYQVANLDRRNRRSLVSSARMSRAGRHRSVRVLGQPHAWWSAVGSRNVVARSGAGRSPGRAGPAIIRMVQWQNIEHCTLETAAAVRIGWSVQEAARTLEKSGDALAPTGEGG
jgi:hypothetical protein